MGGPLDFETLVSVHDPRTTRRVLWGLGLGVGLIGAGPALEQSLLRPPLSIVTLLAGLGVMAVAFVAALRANEYRRERVRVDAQAVHIGNATIRRSDITAAHYGTGSGNLRQGVRLLGKGERVLARITLPDQASADRFIDAVGLASKPRVARFYAISPIGSASWWVALSGLVLGFVLMAVAIPVKLPILILAGVVSMVLASVLFLRCQLHVGADGLLVATRIARRFIPWSEVVRLEPTEKGIRVHRKEGVLELPTTSNRKLRPLEVEEQQALLAHAAGAMAAYRRGERPDVVARVSRNGRTVAEWTRDLLDREGDFRNAPLLDEDLWGVVESPAADASARAGAAAVLARATDGTSQARLRVAADACTAPRLRVVLEKAAAGAEVAEMEEALAEVAEEPAAASRSKQQRDATEA